MKQFIQDIRVLDVEQLKIVNEYIDTLTFNPNTVFDADGNVRADTSVRSSTGTVILGKYICLYSRSVNI